MTAPRFLWPVTDDPFVMRPVATFFEEGDAIDFVTANLGATNLYICEPHYDRRASGYRFVEPLTVTQSDPLRRVA